MQLSEQETNEQAAALYAALAEVLSVGELATEDGRARLLFGEDNEQIEVELEARPSGWLNLYAPLRAPEHWDEPTLRRVLAASLSRLDGATIALSEETGIPLLMASLPMARLDGASLAEILDQFIAQAVSLSSVDIASALASEGSTPEESTTEAVALRV